MKPIIIAIAGGSASGKTTVVNKLLDLFKDDISLLSFDDYYYDLKDMPLEQRMQRNYDHPDSLDSELFCSHLKQLRDGKAINKPTWDFKEHNRSKITETIYPSKIIIAEGILVLNDPKIRELSDIKIFVKCDEDLRFIRRLKRDIGERGRTLDFVIDQYLATVKPMFQQFVRPSSKYADLIIPNDEKHDIALEFLISRIKDILGEN